MRIWKYVVKIERHQTVVMPKGSVLLDMQDQDGELAVWAAVPIERGLHPDNVERSLSVVGTGSDLPSGEQAYVATAQQGPYVWHLFDGGEV